MSGLLFHDPRPQLTPTPAQLGEARPATDFFQNLRAGFEAQTLTDNSLSRESNLFDAYQPIVEALKDQRGRPLFRNPYRQIGTNTGDLDAEVARIWREVARRRQADPQATGGLPGSREALEAQVREQVMQRRRELADVTERQTTGGMVGEFLGAAGSAITDPPNLFALGLGASAGAGVLRTVLVESLIGAGAEAVIQPKVATYYNELGIDYTAADFIANVAVGGAAGGLFAGGVKAAEQVVLRVLQKQARGEPVTPQERAEAASAVAQIPENRLPALAAEAGVRQPGEAEDAARTLEAVADFEHPMPPDAPQADRIAHARLVEQAEEALETGNELPSSPLPSRYAADPIPSTLEALDPRTIEVDARTFQFKEGGDRAGVTDRLQGVRRWDPMKAGTIIVYEFADGRRVIADGHQRLGLAKRLLEQGFETGIRIDARILREVDDVTPDKARVAAAIVNIAQGSGSPIDAARIFRAAPDLIDESLPRNSALVQHAIGLANLNDEAFGLVANRLVREDFGALVGRLAPDEAPLQTALMRVLAQESPANQTEAEALIRQFTAMRADNQEIGDLFGTETLATSLFRERARLVDRVIKALRKDKLVFGTLARNADEIEAAGNVLDADNAAIADVAAQAAEIIMRLANRTGPVAEAFNVNARLAKEQGRYDTATKNVVEAVRGAVARGDLDGLLAGGTGRTFAREAEADAVPLFAGQGNPARGAAGADAPGDLTAFSDPAGDAAKAQSEGLRIGLDELPDDFEGDLFAGADGQGNEIAERLTKSAVLERQAAELDFLDQLQVVCRTAKGAA